MTPQQARMAAMRLRAERPELQNMAVEDLISQIMASDGMGAPGAGGMPSVEGLADIFPTKLSPASPAPMQAARLVAPKPTANIVPGVDVGAFQRAQEIRDRTERGPTPAEVAEAKARQQALIAELPTDTGERPPEVAAVREAAPEEEVVEVVTEKPKFTSPLRPQLEAVQAELEQLAAQRDTLMAQGQPVDANITYGIQIKSGVASKLKAMVDAEEAAVVDAESAAVLERQTNRLTREEELVKQARKRAPGNALIAFGNALAGAKAGEKFASVLTRGLVAGNESYTNARDAGEESRRTIEEKRDQLILKNRELIEKARADAINRANSGVAMTKGEMELANLNQEGVDKLAMAPLKLSAAKSEAEKLRVEALYAPRIAEGELNAQAALAEARRRPPPPRGSGGRSDGSMTENQRQTKIGALNKERRAAMIELNDPTTLPSTKAALRLSIRYIDRDIAELRGSGSTGTVTRGNKVRTYNPKTGKLE